MIKDNIISTDSNAAGRLPGELAGGIADRARRCRLELNLSQLALAKRSGVSLGTLKRFEKTSEISLKHLLLLASAMDAADGFNALFSGRKYSSFEEAVGLSSRGGRKRGMINE
ncbi:MAG: helix-turn-helix domain-containing protein [Spirochaetia bacterium]|nr:helix-turn-helix domain-containing protein [Spirochaetia bacterium]